MFEVVLVNPEIPSNSGAIIRLCANSGCNLHLIHPIAFDLEEKKFRRAGLDYHEFTNLKTWQTLTECINAHKPNKMHFFSTKAQQFHHTANYTKGSMLIFGSETKGLQQSYFDTYGLAQFYRLPMMPNSRSMNLANAVSVVVYEAWRQLNFQQAI